MRAYQQWNMKNDDKNEINASLFQNEQPKTQTSSTQSHQKSKNIKYDSDLSLVLLFIQRFFALYQYKQFSIYV